MKNNVKYSFSLLMATSMVFVAGCSAPPHEVNSDRTYSPEINVQSSASDMTTSLSKVAPASYENYEMKEAAMSISFAKPSNKDYKIKSSTKYVKELSNARSGPSTKYKVIAKYKPGTKLTIVGKNKSGTWYYTSSKKWIAGSQLTTKSPAKAKASTKKPASKATIAKYCDTKPKSIASAKTAKQIMTATNAERKRFGLSQLKWSTSLEKAAVKWSKAQASKKKMSHNPNRPFGGENVAYPFSSNGLSLSEATANAQKAWMASPGHCKNILHPDYKTMGVGFTQTKDKKYWYSAVNFGF